MSSPSPTLGGKQTRDGFTDRTPMNSTMEVTGNKLAVSYTLREAEQNKRREKGTEKRQNRNRKKEGRKKAERDKGRRARTYLHQTRRSGFPG